MRLRDDAHTLIRAADAIQIVRLGHVDLIVLSRASAPNADEHLPLEQAAIIAHRSVRVLRRAIASGDLPGFGKQRSRTVRRGDLDKWIESQAVRVASPDDPDIAARVARLEKARNRKKGKKSR